MDAGTLDLELLALARLADAGVPPALRATLAASLPTPRAALAAARLIEAGVEVSVLLDALAVGADLALVLLALDHMAEEGP
ncbi:MAG: hypothetical protein M0Z46_08795 [Actinomycetota bacterium]|nr:hypothetical protein [Actinomycetota bacterium]